MGAAGSVYQDENILGSVAKVNSATLGDRYRTELKQKEEFLDRQQQMCGVAGFSADTAYAQPLMINKLERTLACIDDMAESHGGDMDYHAGFVEVQTPLLRGSVRVMHPLGDDATFACASDDGSVLIYNWREGCVISEMRTAHTVGHRDGSVTRFCSLNADRSLLASGDDTGTVALWNLAGPTVAWESNLHEGRVSGLQSELSRNWILSTSVDTYVMIYDAHQQQVVERACPQVCGRGVPNTCLTLAEDVQRKLVLVGGRDGKLRIWSKDDGPLKQQFAFSCGNAQPTNCSIASDGWRVIVGTMTTDSAAIAHRDRDRGGLLVFDLRMLSDDEERRIAISRISCDSGAVSHMRSSTSKDRQSSKERASRSSMNSTIGFGDTGGRAGSLSMGEALGRVGSITSGSARGNSFTLGCTMDGGKSHPHGAVDMALVEEDSQVLVMALMDGKVRTYDLSPAGTLSPRYDFDIIGKEDTGATLCAIACNGQFVYTSASTPSLGVWRRTKPDEPHGHDEYIRPAPLPPLILRARCRQMSGYTGLAPADMVRCSLFESLEKDRERLKSLVMHQQ